MASELNSDHYLDLAGGQFASTSRADLDRSFERFAAEPGCNTLLLHFHGGLNTREEGIARARSLLPVYREAGAYPVFFVWESGAHEVIENNLRKILAEPICERLLRLVSRFTLTQMRAGDPMRGAQAAPAAGGALDAELEALFAGHEPELEPDSIARRRRLRLHEAQLRELHSELVNDPVLKSEIDAIANALRVPGAPIDTDPVRGATRLAGYRETLMRPEILERLRPRSGGGDSRALPALVLAAAVAELVVRVHERFCAGRDHGVLATIVEEILLKLYFIGGWFNWMKSEIGDAFGADAERCGGTAFLRGLRRLWDQGRRPRIVLAGHSAGSIYICNFLEHARTHLPDARFDVVFMTPACSFYRFGRTLQANGAAIAALRNLTFSDPFERDDRLLPVYPRSLLYFTSGVLETEGPDVGDLPIVGMQRFYTGAAPYDAPELRAVRDFFMADPARLVWVDGSPRASALTAARSHREFDFDSGTRATLQRMIREGL